VEAVIIVVPVSSAYRFSFYSRLFLRDFTLLRLKNEITHQTNVDQYFIRF